MQPPLLSDARFIVAGHATQWQVLENNVNDLHPELLIVQTDIAPDPEAMKRLLQRLSAWNGVAVVVLPLGQKDLRGAYEGLNMVRGVFIAPVNWTEIAQAGYGAAMTARANMSQTAPMQQASPVLSSVDPPPSSPAPNASRCCPMPAGQAARPWRRTWLMSWRHD